jgi:hypothetical protein
LTTSTSATSAALTRIRFEFDINDLRVDAIFTNPGLFPQTLTVCKSSLCSSEMMISIQRSSMIEDSSPGVLLMSVTQDPAKLFKMHVNNLAQASKISCKIVSPASKLDAQVGTLLSGIIYCDSPDPFIFRPTNFVPVSSVVPDTPEPDFAVPAVCFGAPKEQALS